MLIILCIPCVKCHNVKNELEESQDAVLFFKKCAMLTVKSVPHFGLDLNTLETNMSTAIKFCTDIHGPQRINTIECGDLLTFPLMPLAGQSKSGIIHRKLPTCKVNDIPVNISCTLLVSLLKC